MWRSSRFRLPASIWCASGSESTNRTERKLTVRVSAYHGPVVDEGNVTLVICEASTLIMLYRLSLSLVLAGAAFGQIGYPGGGSPYPGGGSPYPGRSPYPTGGGSPLPFPGGRRGQQKPKDPTQPLPNFQGTLKHMDDKTVSLELGDNRVLDFRRTGRTRFFKEGQEVKSPNWDSGIALSVEASEEPGGYLTAVNVYWQKAGGSTETAGSRSPEKDKAEGTPDTWGKD